MRYLRLQRSQANRRRAEREAERGVQSPAQSAPQAQPDSTARQYPAPAEPELEPRRRKSG